MMQPDRPPRLPLRLYFSSFILWPWWAVRAACRRPAPVVAVLAAVVMITGFGVVAAHAPAGCHYRPVVTAGRMHWACAEAAKG